MKKKDAISKRDNPEINLKRRIRKHFADLGFSKGAQGTLLLPGEGKDTIRALHRAQRSEKINAALKFICAKSPSLVPYFADGTEIDPSRIRLSLRRVITGTLEADLFRLAALTWSVPVSEGFGRRLRYIVWDEGHDKIAGLIALGDPVFNLSVRDRFIGWSAADRSERLVNLLDAYVLGSLPPYNMLLGGKVVACLVRSREIFHDFKRTYGRSVGVISGKAKCADLHVITTTSSMGRSSVYNRLHLDGRKYFSSLGFTDGWGHFHITDKIFNEMREYLRLIGHPYADQHTFGEGPNWRFRTIRTALKELQINEDVLRHGVKREVFISTLSANAIEILRTGKGKTELNGLRTVEEISDLACARWIVPRSRRLPVYREWRRSSIVEIIRDKSFSHRFEAA